MSDLIVPIVSVAKEVHIPTSLWQKNRDRLVAALAEQGVKQGLVLLAGGEAHRVEKYNTDGEGLFRQESYFLHQFGVNEPDMLGMINLADGSATLVIPRLPEEYAIWMGAIKQPAEYAAEYGVQRAIFRDELGEALKTAGDATVYLLKTRNTDSGALLKAPALPELEDVRTDDGLLGPVLSELRVFKTKEEQDVMRAMNLVASEAHLAVMASSRVGALEVSMEGAFRAVCSRVGGVRQFAYTPICASGPNGAVLHYGHAGAPNNRRMQDGDLILNDMGMEAGGYASDITVGFPLNGKFSAEQALVYSAVLNALFAVEDAMKPGTPWLDMHALAYRTILATLKEGGLLQGEVDAMMEANLGSIFQPHGLGHMIGLDTHDVGGYNGGAVRDTRFGYKSLRTTRKLAPGMVVTVEPGCYFADVLIERALANPELAQFIVPEEMQKYRGLGGVRLEDNVIITETGIEVMTRVPRTIQQVEAAVAGELTSIADVETHHGQAPLSA